MIQLTPEQWAAVKAESQAPVRVSDPPCTVAYVLVEAEIYERLRTLFEEAPVTESGREYHLQQFGRRAGWDDPAMNIYEDLDPRRRTWQRRIVAALDRLSAPLMAQVDDCLKAALGLV